MVLENPLSPNWRVARRRKKKATRAKKGTETSALQLLVLTQFFPPDFAATGQLIEELAGQLGKQDVDVSVFTGQPGYAFAEGEAPAVEQKGNVFVKRSRVSQLFANRIRGKAVNGLLYTLRAIAHLARNASRYQVLLVTTAPPFLSVIAYCANIFFRLPYVCLLYDLYPDIAVELGVIRASHPIAKLWRSLNRKIWQRSAGIIVLSDSMKDRISNHCPAVQDKISVIHSWSDDRKITPIDKADNWFAKEHELTDKFVVLYSGNMGRCHDIDTLFQAACKLRDEPIVFVCIGGGAKRTALMESVKAEKLENFRFLPYQEKSVLPYSLTTGDVSLVSVADGMESLVAPSKLYPAMATGRPIAAVCPRNSYLRSLISTAKGGTTFDNGNARGLADYILYLSRNRDEAEHIGFMGRQYMQANFTPEIVSQQYLTVIEAANECKKVVVE
ncbi:MAG: glycosyltransferase family 4 protein [Cyanobacteria bacterium P01_C01_bin.69]